MYSDMRKGDSAPAPLLGGDGGRRGAQRCV